MYAHSEKLVHKLLGHSERMVLVQVFMHPYGMCKYNFAVIYNNNNYYSLAFFYFLFAGCSKLH